MRAFNISILKIRTARIALLWVLYGVLGLTQACIDCACPYTPPYFDFAALRSNVLAPDVNGGTLEISLTPDSITYLAGRSARAPGLFPAAYGCSCAEQGELGPKFPVTGINITADRDFNDTLPAGASLNALFELASADFPLQRYQLDEIGQVAFWNYGFVAPPYGGTLLVSPHAPVLPGLPYHFTVTLTRSDGQSVSTLTPAVSW